MKKSTEASINPEKFHDWSKLEPHDQDRVRQETLKLEEARGLESKSKLGQGEHLSKLQSILLPKKMFLSYIKEVFGMSRATAYRYIELYAVAQSKLPSPVLDMAIQSGTRINAQILKDNPPPKTEDRSKIQEYLSNLRPMRVEVAKSPDVLLKECVNFVSTRWGQLPSNHKARTAFVQSLVGMLLGKFGIANTQSFSPMAVPENFKSQRGRKKAA